MEWSILVERKVRAHPVVVGHVIRQQMAEVPFPQHHDMVEALARFVTWISPIVGLLASRPVDPLTAPIGRLMPH